MIPTIPSYAVPLPTELPENRVDWTVDPRRAVVLVHDMQRYFLAPFPERASPRRELTANVRALLDAASRAGVPVVYSVQPGDMSVAQRGLLRDFWGMGMSSDPTDTGVVDGLEPTSGDGVVTKWRYSAFVGTDLAARLARFRRDQIVVSGVYAHVGCLMTACEAFSMDIQPFFVADAVADFSAEHHAMALEYAASRCASVTTTGAVVDALDTVSVDASPVLTNDHGGPR